MSGRGRGMALTRPAWMRPGAPEPARANVDPAPVPPALPSQRAPPVTDWARATASDGRPYWYSLSTGARTWVDPSVAASQPRTTPTKKKHVSPWRETRDKDGRVYYYNAQTKQSQWERPPEMQNSTVDEESGDANKEAVQPLPEGWAQNTTADGRVYYYHAATRETKWERPKAAADVSRKRPAPDIPIAPKGVVDEWREHSTPDGRTYYYNAKTRATTWTKPTPEGTHGERKRARVDSHPVTDLRQAIVQSREQKDGKGKTDKNGNRLTRRPRSQEGKTLTDHQAETYFLNRAKIRKRSSAGKGDRNGAAIGDKDHSLEFMQLETNEQQEKVFFELLRDRGIDEKSSWLDTMSRCTDDPRYTVVHPYGFRKRSWLKWVQKCAKRARRQSILATRSRSEALLKLMEECFANEPITTAKLDHCDPERVRVFKKDERYQSVDESQRASLLKSFFGIRARNGERERTKRRKECISRMRAALDRMVDPALKPPSRETKKEQNNEKPSETLAVKGTPNGNNVTGQKKDSQTFFNDRTTYRELDKFLSSIPGSDTVSSSDRADITQDWRRTVERWAHDKRVREREARRTMQKERRAKFRSGVERMILDGRIPQAARWKEVADQILKESFAVSEENLDARPSVLYADAQLLFEERVDSHRESFKRLIREANIDIHETTTVEGLQEVKPLETLIKSLDRPVVDALLADRQRKEIKRRQKELRGAIAAYDDLLLKSEIPTDSTFESATDVWKERTAFKQICSLAGEETARKLFKDFIKRRRTDDEKMKEHQNRLKRKFEDQAGGPIFDHEALAALERAKRIRLPAGPVPNVPIPFRAKPVEEESGWAAALSTKPMTAEEKLAAKEKRKRELLQGLGSKDP